MCIFCKVSESKDGKTFHDAKEAYRIGDDSLWVHYYKKSPQTLISQSDGNLKGNLKRRQDQRDLRGWYLSLVPWSFHMLFPAF